MKHILEIIGENIPSGKVYENICFFCGCKFSYTKDDIIYYLPSFQQGDKTLFMDCPMCKSLNKHSPGNISAGIASNISSWESSYAREVNSRDMPIPIYDTAQMVDHWYEWDKNRTIFQQLSCSGKRYYMEKDDKGNLWRDCELYKSVSDIEFEKNAYDINHIKK